MEKLYVLGTPVAHSKSPAMHNALYRELGLDWAYELMDCPDEADALAFLSMGDFLGINITMPYKPRAFRRADRADSSAVLAQGANVLVWEPGEGGLGEKQLAAYNMDGYGCVRYLEREGVSFGGARVVVCGTGPTSLAILHASIVAGASSVALLGRDAERTRRVYEGWASRAAQTADGDAVARVDAVATSYGEAAGAIADATLIVDATPLGMKPGDPAPFDTSLLKGEATVFDVVYGHGETALAAAAREAGCAFLNGEGMLVGQAVLGAEKFLAAGGALPEGDLDFDRAFRTMARAAGFTCA